MLYDIWLFFETFWQPLSVISMAALLYCTVIHWYGRISISQTIALFLTGIIVITCIFLPFNWSIWNSGQTQEIRLFFFNINIEGSNFIQSLKITLESGNITNNNANNAVTFFLAFLEEISKLTLLILLVKKVLKWPLVLVGFVLLGKIVYEYYGMEGIPLVQTISVGTVGFIIIIILWVGLTFSRQLESISDYIFSIALVAVWFAFAENIKYMLDLFHSGQTQEMIFQNAILRSIFWYLSHIFFSMICVLIYSRGRFAFLRAIDNTGNLSSLQKALGWESYTFIMTWLWFIQGVIVATLLHGYYNIMISQPDADLIIPSAILIVGFMFLELFVLHSLHGTSRYWHIESTVAA